MKSLTNFLLENKVYNQFLDNFYAAHNSLANYYKHVSKLDQITLAFVWETTKEGYDFWDEVNKKWLKYLFDVFNN